MEGNGGTGITKLFLCHGRFDPINFILARVENVCGGISPRVTDLSQDNSLANVVKVTGEFEPCQQAAGFLDWNGCGMNHLVANIGKQAFLSKTANWSNC